MKGTITLNSQINSGTTFELQIPMEVVSTLDESHISADVPLVVGYKNQHGQEGALRILIVDDVSDNREVLYNLLMPLGFELQQAQNGRECVRLAQSWEPHLILMDVRMPMMDGLEATRALRQIPALSHTPIVAVTAGAFEEDRHNSLIAGCNAHINKPIYLQDLLDILAQWLPLTWCYASAEESAHDLHTLLPEQLIFLTEAVRRGDIQQLLELINELEHTQCCSLLTAKIKLLTDGFNIKELRRLVETLGGKLD
jgi:CheY-like chemotaxis protein